MSFFNYKAKKGLEEIVEGRIEAEDKESAIFKIEKMGYTPIRIIESQTVSTPDLKFAWRRLELFKRVQPKDRLVFTEQLTVLIKSKVPLYEAMNILSVQTENNQFKEVISSIARELKEGESLSQALRKYPQIFPALYVNLIASGEAGGVLEKTLFRLAKFLEKQEEIKTKISSALAYPVFVMIIGIITIALLLIFGVPKLVNIFVETGQVLPLPTRILILVSDVIRKYWYGIVLLIGVSILFFRRKLATREGRMIWDGFKLKVPILGDFLKKVLLAEFSRTFATLLANGIPAFQALWLTIPTVNNGIFKKELEEIHKNIVAGDSFAQSMERSNWFPILMTNMIAVSEKGGGFQDSLIELSNFYQREIDKTTKVLTSLLEPIIILTVGLMVGFIVMAMLLPVFQMNLGM